MQPQHVNTHVEEKILKTTKEEESVIRKNNAATDNKSTHRMPKTLLDEIRKADPKLIARLLIGRGDNTLLGEKDLQLIRQGYVSEEAVALYLTDTESKDLLHFCGKNGTYKGVDGKNRPCHIIRHRPLYGKDYITLIDDEWKDVMHVPAEYVKTKEKEKAPEQKKR